MVLLALNDACGSRSAGLTNARQIASASVLSVSLYHKRPVLRGVCLFVGYILPGSSLGAWAYA